MEIEKATIQEYIRLMREESHESVNEQDADEQIQRFVFVFDLIARRSSNSDELEDTLPSGVIPRSVH